MYSSSGQKMPSVQCAPGTYVKTVPRRQTDPKLTHPSPCTSRLGQLPDLSLPCVSLLYLPGSPESAFSRLWHLCGHPSCPSVNQRAPFVPSLCGTQSQDLSSRIQTCGAFGGVGGGVQDGRQDGWQPLYLCLSPPLSAYPHASNGVGGPRGEGAGRYRDQCGGHLRVDVCSGPVDLQCC